MSLQGPWRLNGIELKGVDVRIVPTMAELGVNVRQSLLDIHDGSQHREKLGIDLAVKTIEFSFISNESSKVYNELADVLSVLEDDEVWTLEAPQGHYVYKNNVRAAFSTRSYKQSDEKGIGRATLRVEAIVNGVWVTDGGAYCEEITGHFELTSTGPNSFTRDDGTVTGTTPLLEIPEQFTGYPLGIRASDFAEVQISGPDSTRTEINENGLTVTYETYDLTGFLIPEPTTAGDVGVYQICSSPTELFLGGGEDTSVIDGIAQLAVGQEEVGG